MSGHKSLRVYQLAYQLAMEIIHLCKEFPSEERYSLTDQIRRSSRSVPANIAEGYRKRQYPKAFVLKMTDADGEATETGFWLDVAKDCEYLPITDYQRLTKGYEEVGKMLGNMIHHPEKFLPRQEN